MAAIQNIMLDLITKLNHNGKAKRMYSCNLPW